MLFHRTSSVSLSPTANLSLTIKPNIYRVGDLRIRLPVANAPYNGTYNASYFGPACPQLPFTFNPSVASTIAPIFEPIEDFFATSNNTQSEDCEPKFHLPKIMMW